ncbi:MAG: RHS repeat-associated core domain-containing protein [Planctomycetota bacterium]|nr:MAG: RHS repeat-associated core domain-containing protein [Planctomycetota bacterium]
MPPPLPCPTTATLSAQSSPEKSPVRHSHHPMVLSLYDSGALTTFTYDATTFTYDATTFTYDNSVMVDIAGDTIAAGHPSRKNPVPRAHPHTIAPRRLRRLGLRHHPTPRRPKPYPSVQTPSMHGFIDRCSPRPTPSTHSSLVYDSTTAPTPSQQENPDGTLVSLVQSYGYTGRRYDSETDQWYFRARYFDSELGRFISRDPLGYVDGLSMYRGYYVPNGIDPSGTDFIAVAQRGIHDTPGIGWSTPSGFDGGIIQINHLSLQYWKTWCPSDKSLQDDPALGSQHRIDSWKQSIGAWGVKHKETSEYQEGFELLNVNKGYEMFNPRTFETSTIRNGVSVIHYAEEGTHFRIVYVGDEDAVASKWAELKEAAQSYEFAEQEGFSGNFQNWPNSRYVISSSATNSNTFVREMLRRTGLPVIEPSLNGPNPGAAVATPPPDIYEGMVPRAVRPRPEDVWSPSPSDLRSMEGWLNYW